MTPVEFEEALDRHGGDPNRWPVAMRVAAIELLHTSVAARAACAAMAEVESILRQSRPDPATGVDQIAARATGYRQSGRANHFANRARWAAAAAAAICLGVAVGGMTLDYESPSHIMAAAFSPMEPSDVD